MASDRRIAGGLRRLVLRVPAISENPWWFVVIVVAVFRLTRVLTRAGTLVADDYWLAFRFGTHERLRDLGDVLASAGTVYMTWSGRLVGTFLSQAVNLAGKPVFDVANAAVVVLLSVLIYLHAVGTGPRRASILCAAPLLLWFGLPSFGTSVLWMTGSTNYTWTAVLILAALLPFRRRFEDPAAVRDSFFSVVGLALLGVVAGCTNESTAPAMVVLMGACLVDWRRRGKKVPVWAVAEILGVSAGVAVMLLAPGNAVRIAAVGGPGPSLATLAQRFASISAGVVQNNLFALMLLFGVIAVILHRFRGPDADVRLRAGAGYLAAALLATYAMLAAPAFPARAWTQIIILAITAVLTLVAGLDFEDALVRRVVALTLAGLLVMFAVGYATVYSDLGLTQRKWAYRVRVFKAARKAGRTSVVVQPIKGLTPYDPAYGAPDLRGDPTLWPNTEVAAYFGLDLVASSTPP